MNFDTIYNDIVTNVLPKVQEGLTITKDYVFDFLDRYITYLIIIDSLTIVFTLTTFTIITYIYMGTWKAIGKGFRDSYDIQWDRAMYKAITTIVYLILLLIHISILCISTTDLVKTLTIPELRIYEEYQLISK